jgi:hypothetical protein
MSKIQRKFVESCLLILLLLTLFLLASLSATAQETTNSQVVQDKVARKGERSELKQPNNFQPLPCPHCMMLVGSRNRTLGIFG